MLTFSCKSISIGIIIKALVLVLKTFKRYTTLDIPIYHDYLSKSKLYLQTLRYN